MQIRLVKDESHFHAVQIGEVTIYFSYAVPIAFHEMGFGLFVTKEKYSVTTSKHLGYVKREFSRFTELDDFDKKLADALHMEA